MEEHPYMKHAFAIAEEALLVGEVPIGCVIVGSNAEIIGGFLYRLCLAMVVCGGGGGVWWSDGAVPVSVHG
jgi:tRNA(Arg) A34 adenosine deaminase TadA